MGELQPRWENVISIWWLTRWRSSVGVMVVAFPGFLILGIFLLFPSLPSAVVSAAEIFITTAIGLAALAITFVVDGMALRKRYLDFRIALLPLESGAPEIAPSAREIRAFWWLLIWRGVGGVILINLALNWALEKPLTAIGFPGAVPFIRVFSVACALVWENFVMRMAITKRYRHFRIALIEEPRPEGDEPKSQW